MHRLQKRFTSKGNNMKTTIKTALESLLKNSGDGWFCIIEEPKTEKFVQFAYDQKEGIWFDLPKPALTDEELELAKTLLAKYDIKLFAPSIGADVEDLDCGLNEDVFKTFNKHLGTDIELATEIAYAVMRKVYKLGEDTNLDITLTR